MGLIRRLDSFRVESIENLRPKQYVLLVLGVSLMIALVTSMYIWLRRIGIKLGTNQYSIRGNELIKIYERVFSPEDDLEGLLDKLLKKDSDTKNETNENTQNKKTVFDAIEKLKNSVGIKTLISTLDKLSYNRAKRRQLKVSGKDCYGIYSVEQPNLLTSLIIKKRQKQVYIKHRNKVSKYSSLKSKSPYVLAHHKETKKTSFYEDKPVENNFLAPLFDIGDNECEFLPFATTNELKNHSNRYVDSLLVIKPKQRNTKITHQATRQGSLNIVQQTWLFNLYQKHYGCVA